MLSIPTSKRQRHSDAPMLSNEKTLFGETLMVSYWHLRKPKAFGNASSRFYSADGRMLAGHGAELNEE